MQRISLCLSSVVLLLLVGDPRNSYAQIPSFSGAEGAGANATGGRPVEKLNYYPNPSSPVLEKRGIVYHVTTLDPDPGGVIEGSLSYGLKTENFLYRTHPFQDIDPAYPDTFDVTPRIIVFDVGGTIDFSGLPENQRDIDIAPMNVTIAGQTAPGGITIHGGEFNPGHKDVWDEGSNYPDKTNNLILRNFAVRTNNPQEKDGIWLAASNSIADHLSLSWYTDEGVSITDSARNVTVQHSIVGPGWNNPDGDGSQIEGKTPMADISVHHNLYIHNDARIPRVGEKPASGAPGVELDFRNNVIFNFNDSKAGYSVAGEPSFTNFVNNYYIGGPGNSAGDNIFSAGGSGASALTRIYQSGNHLDLNKNGVADGTDPGWSRFAGNEIQQASPYSVPHGVTQTAGEALETVQNYVGARWWERDFLDERSLNQLATLGQGTIAETGQVLNTLDPNDVSAVVNAPLQTRPANYDTDNDGMPDYWEQLHGLNPNSAPGDLEWQDDFDGDGYINIEEFINEIAEWPAPDPIVFTGGANARYEQITNWSITRPSPGEADTTTHWQPSKFDVAVIGGSTVTVDSVGQHAGRILVGTAAGFHGTLTINSGWLQVEDAGIGPGDGTVLISANELGNGTLNLTGGKLIAKRLAKGAYGNFNFTGGTLSAETVGFDLVNDGGIIAPGESPGMTHVMGDLVLNSGVLQLEIGGTGAGEYDMLVVDGATTLGGTLQVLPIDLGGGPYKPTLGDTFLLVASQNGFDDQSFDDFDLPELADGLKWDLSTDAMALSLSVVESALLAGDYNDDGIVDAADYTVWRDHLGEEDETNINFHGDGNDVGLSDYTLWKQHFGNSSSGSGGFAESQPAAVPEPSVYVMTILAALLSSAARTRRRCADAQSI